MKRMPPFFTFNAPRGFSGRSSIRQSKRFIAPGSSSARKTTRFLKSWFRLLASFSTWQGSAFPREKTVGMKNPPRWFGSSGCISHSTVAFSFHGCGLKTRTGISFLLALFRPAASEKNARALTLDRSSSPWSIVRTEASSTGWVDEPGSTSWNPLFARSRQASPSSASGYGISPWKAATDAIFSVMYRLLSSCLCFCFTLAIDV